MLSRLQLARSTIIKKHIFDFTSTEELAKFLAEREFPKFRASQILDWVYDKFVLDLGQMSNLPENLKKVLNSELSWEMPNVIDEQIADDSSLKVALRLADEGIIESVLISTAHRMTLCVSTQIGCKMGCRFCATGKLGFTRNLTSAEIVAQIFWAGKTCAQQGKRLSNLVYMGMGEPLDNYEATLFSVRSAKGFFGLGAKRIVISTCGLPEQVLRLAQDESNLKLAVSLHSAVDDQRRGLMPIAKRYSLQALKKALLTFAKNSPFKLTFEYILLPKVNMDNASAKALIAYLKDLPAKINFIPYNKVDGLEFASPSQSEIAKFCANFNDSRLTYTMRNSQGSKVQAACGQLARKKS